MKKRYTLPAIEYARAALERGVLSCDKGKWFFGKRAFDSRTIDRLLDLGEAVREGYTVKKA